MATHSSILAWENLMDGRPAVARVGRSLATKQSEPYGLAGEAGEGWESTESQEPGGQEALDKESDE